MSQERKVSQEERKSTGRTTTRHVLPDEDVAAIIQLLRTTGAYSATSDEEERILERNRIKAEKWRRRIARKQARAEETERVENDIEDVSTKAVSGNRSPSTEE